MIKVLLIDDDPDEYIIFLDAIRCLPVQIHCTHAHSAEQAFEMLEHVQPDFIFVDMNMPRINGLDCIKKLKGFNNGLSQLIVIYSTHMDEALCQRAKMAGAADCLKKMDSIDMLAEKLAQYFCVA